MPDGLVMDEHAVYAAVAARLPQRAAAARPVLCGFSACVDSYLALERALPALFTADDPRGRDLGRRLAERAIAGRGGEMRCDWPEGPAVLDRLGTGTLAIGGTGAQAANMLSLAGAPAVLALVDRTERQLAVLRPEVLLAEEDGLVPVRAARAGGTARPTHYILEFTAGQRIEGVALQRSSRVILRFAEDELEQDEAFVRQAKALARSAGGAILSGFNGIPKQSFAASLAWVRYLAAGWRRAGLALVHLEFADFPDPQQRRPVLDGFRGAVTSLGLSLSELDAVVPGADPADAKARWLAATLDLERVCVHADQWALAITRGDPVCELEALRMGCLLAAARAERGEITIPRGAPAAARFEPPPWPAITPDPPWSRVACPAPWLPTPKSTIGLGDTFLAGCLLVLAGGDTTRIPQPQIDAA